MADESNTHCRFEFQTRVQIQPELTRRSRIGLEIIHPERPPIEKTDRVGGVVNDLRLDKIDDTAAGSGP